MCYIYQFFSKLTVITLQMDDVKRKTEKHYRIPQI